MSKRSASDTFWIVVAILVLVVLVVVYILSAGNINGLKTESPEEKENAQRRKKLHQRKQDLTGQLRTIRAAYNRVQETLRKKQKLKAKLDKIALYVFFLVRFIIVSGILTFCYYGYACQNLPLTDVFDYLTGSTILLGLLGFLFYGNPANWWKLWELLKKRLTIWVYRKYINLEEHFPRHLLHIKQLTEKEQAYQAELEQTEKELAQIMNEDNT